MKHRAILFVFLTTISSFAYSGDFLEPDHNFVHYWIDGSLVIGKQSGGYYSDYILPTAVTEYSNADYFTLTSTSGVGEVNIIEANYGQYPFENGVVVYALARPKNEQGEFCVDLPDN